MASSRWHSPSPTTATSENCPDVCFSRAPAIRSLASVIISTARPSATGNAWTSHGPSELK
eukprot:scaffold297145_cov22-Prasinocladus_malaysianus.AAC.1